MTKVSKLIGNPVEHPAHYTNHHSGIEAIVFCEKMHFCIGNAFKYLYRLDKKWDSIEDLKKADWYIRREEFINGDDSQSLDVFDLNLIWEVDYAMVSQDIEDAIDSYNIRKVVGENPENIEKALFYLWWWETYGVDDVGCDDDTIVAPLSKARIYINNEIKKREAEQQKGKE